MLELKAYLSAGQSRLRAFLDGVVEKKGPALFKDTIFLSFLGARICYASTRPLALFAEKRFQDQEELLAFLLRLKASGHTSIFAHSPVVLKVSPEERQNLSPFLYKAWWSPEGDRVCLNLRHLAEVYDEDKFQKVILASLKESHNWADFPCYYLRVGEKGPYLVEKRPLAAWIERMEEHQSLWAEPEIFVIDVARSETEPFGWLAVVVEGMSRLFSHQYVRHTWLNFNQRSHRYTEVDQFVCPPSFPPQAKNLYEKEIEESLKAYHHLLEMGIKKEDARFVTLQGAATTVLATAPWFVWQDFVLKRRHLKAQWEIRNLARAIELVLRELEVNLD